MTCIWWLLVAGVAARTAEVTPETFDEHAFSGVSSFLKFYAPWCGHCKAMAPAWDELTKSFTDSSKIFIGEIDCTQHETLCKRFKVEGYPTVKFVQGGDVEMQDYEGELNFEALHAFATTSVMPVACTMKTRTTACDADQLKLLDEYMALSNDERQAKYDLVAGPVREEQEKLNALMDKMDDLEEKIEAQEEVVDAMKKQHGAAIRLVRSTLEEGLPKVVADDDDEKDDDDDDGDHDGNEKDEM
mgnify:CR=1 FL=1